MPTKVRVATARELRIGEVLSALFYSQMVTPPEQRREGTREDFHRLLFGMISNRMTRWEDAVALPHLLCERLQCNDVLEGLTSHSVDEIAEVIARPKALHRYPTRIATSLTISARQISETWSGNLSEMWRDEPLPSTLVARLKTLHGVGDKIGNLTARCLLLDYTNVSVWSGLSSLRPSCDRHVLRVFYRLGLTKSEQDITGLYEASELVRPHASLECEGAWVLGLEWCKAGDAPRCTQCPLVALCPSAV